VLLLGDDSMHDEVEVTVEVEVAFLAVVMLVGLLLVTLHVLLSAELLMAEIVGALDLRLRPFDILTVAHGGMRGVDGFGRGRFGVGDV
jgi:hypothetical protein